MNKTKVTDNWVKINDHQVHYVTKGEGFPLLLLHGGGNDWKEWLSNIDTFSKSYRVIAPDCIGFGQTDRLLNHDYTIEDFVSFTEVFISSLKIESVNIIGHSLGGRIVLEYAYRHPEKVKRLIAVTPFGMGQLSRKGFVIAVLAYWIRKLTFQRQPYPIIKIDYSDGEIKNFSDRLQKIKVPSLILWGQKDRYVSVEQGYRMQKLIPASSLEVFNCGHTPQREESKHFNKIVLNFMDGSY